MTDFTKASEGKHNSVHYTDTEGNTHQRNGGTRAWRNNNPGNLRYGEFAKNNGAIGKAGGFAVFTDEATGRKALSTLLDTETYQKLTVGEVVKRYAPPAENNTEKYTRNIETLSGIKADKEMSDLNNTEKDRLVGTIMRLEGWKEGETISGERTDQQNEDRKSSTLDLPISDIEESDIEEIIGSDAYNNAAHPKHAFARQKVTDWYEYHYGNEPVLYDATGRAIPPSRRTRDHASRPSGKGDVHVRSHERSGGKVHVDAYDRARPHK